MSVKRKLRALFGEKEKIEGLVNDGDSKLKELDRHTKITFETATSQLLKKVDGDLEKLQALLQSVREEMGGFRDEQKAILKCVSRPYNQMLDWLLSLATLRLNQPGLEFEEMKGTTWPRTCD